MVLEQEPLVDEFGKNFLFGAFKLAEGQLDDMPLDGFHW